jgi:DNA primase
MTITRDEAEKNIRNNPDIYFKKHLSKHGKKGYSVCPKCKIHELQVDPKNKGCYTCFTCNAYGDVFYFIGLEYELNNFKLQLDKAIEIYWIDWVSRPDSFA